MSKNKHIPFVAAFLIVLVLTLPFYTSVVYATPTNPPIDGSASINNIIVKGSSGIGGFAKQNDYLDFSASVISGNGTITKERLSLGSSIKFSSCSASIDGFVCILRYPSSGKQDFEARLIPFTINLYKNDGTIQESKQGNVIIDNKPPQITLSAAKKFSSS